MPINTVQVCARTIPYWAILRPRGSGTRSHPAKGTTLSCGHRGSKTSPSGEDGLQAVDMMSDLLSPLRQCLVAMRAGSELRDQIAWPKLPSHVAICLLDSVIQADLESNFLSAWIYQSMRVGLDLAGSRLPAQGQCKLIRERLFLIIIAVFYAAPAAWIRQST